MTPEEITKFYQGCDEREWRRVAEIIRALLWQRSFEVSEEQS